MSNSREVCQSQVHISLHKYIHRVQYIIFVYTVSGLNGVAVARHGLKLWQNGATACKILMDTFWDHHIIIFN